MTIKLKLFFMFIMLPPLLYGQNKLVEESIIYSSDISSYKKKIEKTIFFAQFVARIRFLSVICRS